MYARAKTILTLLMALVFAVPLAGAQQYGPGQGRAAFSQQQLDQMLAPIALYPDALLSQILMASTYPREVVEAARWSRRNPGLNGDRAVRAAEQADWDPSVKSLVAFPQILDMMDEKLNWTEDLGDAFLDQETQIMDTVQYLRRKAYTAGSLSSSDQYRVDLEDSSFVIRFANPEAVYLPYYNPTIVYGTWWWPAYQPVYWAPWPGYYSRAGYARGYAWGPAIPVSRGFFFGAPDWRQRRVTVVNVNNYYFRPVTVNRTVEVTRNVNVAPAAAHVWQHDTAHRRDAPYRDAASRHAIARATAAPEVRYEQQHERPDFNGNRNDKHNRHDNGRRNDNDNGRGRAGNAPAPAVAAQPEVRQAPVQSHAPAAADNTPRGADTRGGEGRGRDQRPQFEGRAQIANAPAPAAVAPQPVPRSAPVAPNTTDSTPRGGPGRDQATREQRGNDRPSFEGRGEGARRPEMNQRPEARVESGNRQALRENMQPMVASTNARPAPAPAPVVAVAREPAPRVAPAPVQAPAQPAATPAAVEQRPAAPAVAGRAEARPAGGRDRANNAAPERADNANSRRP